MTVQESVSGERFDLCDVMPFVDAFEVFKKSSRYEKILKKYVTEDRCRREMKRQMMKLRVSGYHLRRDGLVEVDTE